MGRLAGSREGEAVLAAFKIAKYELHLRAEEPLALPSYKGATLRGVFGRSLRRICCVAGQPSCHGQHGEAAGGPPTDCPQASSCCYARIFESTAAEASSAQSSRRAARYTPGAEIARPFVFEPPLDSKSSYERGEALAFNLLLFGEALADLPYFLVAFREMEPIGRPRQRGRITLDQVWAVNDVAGSKLLVYSSEDRLVRNHEAVLTAEDIAQPAAGTGGSDGPPKSQMIRVRFETNTRLKYLGRWADRIEFHVLISRLIDRIAAIGQFHCDAGGDLIASLCPGHDPKSLINLARQITIEEDRSRLGRWTRHSARQHKKIQMDGFVGEVTYAGELQPFLPLLLLGQYTHVGKGCVFGLGKYRLSAGSPS